jgi:hypothetical protein
MRFLYCANRLCRGAERVAEVELEPVNARIVNCCYVASFVKPLSAQKLSRVRDVTRQEICARDNSWRKTLHTRNKRLVFHQRQRLMRGKWCRQQDSNPRPRDYKSRALPTELYRRRDGFYQIGRACPCLLQKNSKLFRKNLLSLYSGCRFSVAAVDKQAPRVSRFC